MDASQIMNRDISGIDFVTGEITVRSNKRMIWLFRWSDISRAGWYCRHQRFHEEDFEDCFTIPTPGTYRLRVIVFHDLTVWIKSNNQQNLTYILISTIWGRMHVFLPRCRLRVTPLCMMWLSLKFFMIVGKPIIRSHNDLHCFFG
jgi:hypothetical protein